MTVAGVPNELIDAFDDVSLACWRDRRDTVEQTGEEEAGISRTLLNARRIVHRAIRAHLLHEDERSSLLDEAVATTHRVLSSETP